MEVAPYLSFDGTCVEAFDFYAETLGGVVEFRMSYGESPMGEHTPDSHKDRIMHSSLRIGERLIMGADAPPQWFSKPQGFSVSINDPDTARMGAVFATLAEGGTVMMPFAPTFWSEGFGMCIDKYGTPWIVNGAEKPMA